MSTTDQDQTAVSAAGTSVPGTGEPDNQIRGRFRLVYAPQGGALLFWTTDLCDMCLNHGCGTQREMLDLTPGGAMKTYLKLRAWQKNGVPE